MSSERILRMLNEVKEEYIEDAEGMKDIRFTQIATRFKCKFPVIRLAIAACIALVVIVGSWQMFGNASHSVTLENGDRIEFARANDIASRDMNLPGPTRELTEEEIQSLFGNLAIEVYWAYFDEVGNCIGLQGELSGVKVVISATDLNLRDTIVDGTQCNSKVDGVDITAGYFVMKPNSQGERTIIYYAEFTLGATTIYVEDVGAKAVSEAVRKNVADTIQQFIEKGEPEWANTKY